MREGGDCENPEQITADDARVNAARQSFAAMSSLGQTAEPVVQQACMRPCPSDAYPVMGPVPGTSNAFISAGHNCWGILWAPISGKVMSELLLQGRAQSVDLSPFDPGRFGSAGKRRSGRGRHQGDVAVGEQW
eukprot:scaffold178_cov255-Pinguiococcus_pyrenoidosus.AAC.23